MKSRHVLAASALALALSACGQSPAPTAEPPVAAPATEEAAAPAPVEAAPVAPAPVAATGSKPASCTQFTINLKHAGAMAVNVMGHNVVVAKEADMAGIAADGMSLTPEHVKPDDARIIAHTRMVGGGESASVTFDVAKVKDGGPFKFFCSFPGHLALMQGNLVVQ